MLRFRHSLSYSYRRRRPCVYNLDADVSLLDTKSTVVPSSCYRSIRMAQCFATSSSENHQEQDIPKSLDSSYASTYFQSEEMRRLMKVRNVGILAHVDAGKEIH